MLKIIALNDCENEEELLIETASTNEVQETIAEFEYVRALQLKSQGKVEISIAIFNELLETNVLNKVNDISFENSINKLSAIRFNCYKNIAIIYEDKGELELALQHYLSAMKIDDSDVYITHRLGQLALKLNALDVADYAFGKCLIRNPNHWPAVDGILQTLCRHKNVMGAYGWALEWHLHNENFVRALNVLSEITYKFPDLIRFYEIIWKTSIKKLSTHNYSNIKGVCLEASDLIAEEQKMHKLLQELTDMRVREPTLLNVGRYILSIYNRLKQNNQCLVFTLEVDDIVDLSAIIYAAQVPQERIVSFDEYSKASVSNGSRDNGQLLLSVHNQNLSTDCSSEFVLPSPTIDNEKTINLHVDSATSKQETESSKPKARRRCSDLSFLEQWGWHKNRRHSSRKKSQQDRPELDQTLNGLLRRIFLKYTEMSFRNEWPFRLENDKDSEKKLKMEDDFSDCVKQSCERIPFDMRKDFEDFLCELKERTFDLTLLIFKWLKYTSTYWSQLINEEWKDIYCEIFSFYMKHYDLCTWNQMTNSNFNISFQICLFYLEIDFDRTVTKNGQITIMWEMVLHHLTFNSGRGLTISDENYDNNRIRLANIEYCWNKYSNRLDLCIERLKDLESLLSQKEEIFNLYLPNLKNFQNTINKKTIERTKIELERLITLKKVSHLFETYQWLELVKILTDTLEHDKDLPNCDAWNRDMQTKFEVLLQALWNIYDYEKCLMWAERGVQYFVAKYLAEDNDTSTSRKWAECINYALAYIEALLLNEGYDLLNCLGIFLHRMVQNIISLLTYQLDSPLDKNSCFIHLLEIKRPWVVLHQVLLRDEHISPIVIKPKHTGVTAETEEMEDLLPHSFLLLFTAHEFLGKRQWCTRDGGALLQYTLDAVSPNLRAPLYDSCRDIVHEYIEQITYCLYGFPPKKARSRHIEEHEATSVELEWLRAIQLFDLYRPEILPEFNSYKVESITADMEQFLLKIVSIIPKELDPTTASSNIQKYITGHLDSLPNENKCVLLPYRIASIYYLLADYYFKNRDFSKTFKYYTLDLTCHPTRFDSWAGIALSKATKIETKLNSFLPIELNIFLIECEDTLRCFEQCIKLNRQQTLLWIEYGSFAYTLHSFCSRDLKHSSDTLSLEQFAFVEERKDKFLNISYNCFTIAAALQNVTEKTDTESIESHDEKWLNQYMLGKISEKRKDQPKIYMNHYLRAANFLYENNATYPIKINHSNPTTLSVEALEIYYRTNSAILKYLEQDKEISWEVGTLFNRVLKTLSNSPFAFNKAKIDGNSLNVFKRKIVDKTENTNETKLMKLEVDKNNVFLEIGSDSLKSSMDGSRILANKVSDYVTSIEKKQSINDEIQVHSNLSRRDSQESTATSTTSTSSSVSSTSETDSSSMDSDNSCSETSSTEEERKNADKNTPFSERELDHIYKTCVMNLEECITRFPEHYKSIYRLVHHYMNAPKDLQDLNQCYQLLLGQYTTNLGNHINGLFFDRKNNNLFNGIWRIPSSEIDRPGSFPTHLVKCVNILIQVLRKSNDFKLLLDIGLQLYRNPENDKRYIKDIDRMELCQQALTYCVQILRSIHKKNMNTRDDSETLNLLIDIYKAYKKCNKHMIQKEPLFTQLLAEVYKFYIENKIQSIPENINYQDLAIKLCIQELNIKRNQEKLGVLKADNSNLNSNALTQCGNKFSQIPGIVGRSRGRPVGSKNITTPVSCTASGTISISKAANLMSQTENVSEMDLCETPLMMSLMHKKPNDFPEAVEFYNIIGGAATANASALPSSSASSNSSSELKLFDFKINPQLCRPCLSFETEPNSVKIPSFDIKKLIETAASQASEATKFSQVHSTTINVGGGKLTITPTTSRSSICEEYTTTTVSTPSNITRMSANTSISLQKVVNQSANICIKALADLEVTKSTIVSEKLVNFPKTLSITSKVPDLQARQLSYPSVLKDTSKTHRDGLATKTKTLSKRKQLVNKTPYTRPEICKISLSPPLIPPKNTTKIPGFSGTTGLNDHRTLINSFDLNSYNQQATVLTAYAEILKSIDGGANPVILTKLSQQFQMLGQNISPVQGNRTPKQIFEIPTEASSLVTYPSRENSCDILANSKSISSDGMTENFLHANSKSSINVHSSAIEDNEVFAKLIAPQVSPTKTLQQKLAERQKANLMNENATSKERNKLSNIDVIILD